MTQKIEEAKRLYKTANADQKYVLESLFPELAESEDEKIRKALIEMVHDTTGDSLWVDYNVHKEDALAWLEKQGEEKPYGQREECFDCQFNYAGECKGSCAMKRSEQKPADKVEPKFKVKYAGSEYNVLEVKDIAGVTYYGIEDEPNHIDYVQAENCERVGGYSIKENGSPYPTKPAVFSEKKPTAWSEEDEVRLQACIDTLQAKSIIGKVDTNTYKPAKIPQRKIHLEAEWRADGSTKRREKRSF